MPWAQPFPARVLTSSFVIIKRNLKSVVPKKAECGFKLHRSLLFVRNGVVFLQKEVFLQWKIPLTLHIQK